MKIVNILFDCIFVALTLMITTSLDLDRWLYYVITTVTIFIIIRTGDKLFGDKK